VFSSLASKRMGARLILKSSIAGSLSFSWAGSVFSCVVAEGPHVPDELLADLLRVLHHPLVVHLLPRLRDVGILDVGDEQIGGQRDQSELGEERPPNGPIE